MPACLVAATVTNERGDVLPGAVAEVRETTGALVADLYADAALTTPIPAAVLTADNRGHLAGYVNTARLVHLRVTQIHGITIANSYDSIAVADPITGGGGGGGIDPATLTTKGDLLVATGPSTVIRLPAGANDTFLVADSTQASGWSRRALVAADLTGKIGAGAPGGVATLDAGGRVPKPQLPRVTELVLADAAPFKTANQEGGRIIKAGTFIPDADWAEITIDLQGASVSYGGHVLLFSMGIAPVPPPTPWCPKNLIVQHDAFSGPLPGVTDFKHYSLGFLPPNQIGAKAGQPIRRDDLIPGTTYSWELFAGGQSGYKQPKLEAGAAPKYLSPSPGRDPVTGEPTADDLYVWAACAGNNTLQLIQLGWGEFGSLLGYPAHAQTVARIPLPGVPASCRTQPVSGATGGQYVALIDSTNSRLLIVDGVALTVSSYPLPNGDVPWGNPVWNAAGTKLWIGTFFADPARVHRFDLATRVFDQTVDIVAGAFNAANVLDRATDDSFILVFESTARQLHKINTTTFAVTTLGAPQPNAVTAGRCLKTGNFIVLDLPANLIRHLSATGVQLNTISVALAGHDTADSFGNLDLDDEHTRVFYVADGAAGWAWIASGFSINGPSHMNAGAGNLGEICNTRNETTVLASAAGDNWINVWPGGFMHIRPATKQEHLKMRFVGGVAVEV